MTESIKKIENNKMKEYNNLLDEYIDLIEKREDIIFKKQPRLESKYILSFSILMKEEISTAINIKKLRIKIDYFLSNYKSKRNLKLDKVDEIINRDIRGLLEELRKIDELIEISKKNLEVYKLTDSEEREAKEIFEALTKRLHPDFNNSMTKTKNKLWDRTRKAYDKNDLETLRFLSNILQHEIEDHNKYSIQDLKGKIETLSCEIKSIEKRFPLDIQEYIDDKEWIEGCKYEIKTRIKNMKDDENNLIELLNILKSEVSYE